MLFLALAGLVTVTLTPTPLPEALEKLSSVTGERLECVPALKRNLLMARLKDADHDRVLREIALALDAKWEVDESRRLLKPDPSLAAKRDAEAAKARSLRWPRGCLN